MEGKARI